MYVIVFLVSIYGCALIPFLRYTPYNGALLLHSNPAAPQDNPASWFAHHFAVAKDQGAAENGLAHLPLQAGHDLHQVMWRHLPCGGREGRGGGGGREGGGSENGVEA